MWCAHLPVPHICTSMTNPAAGIVPALMTVEQVSAYLGISVNTLNYWRKPEVDKGPPWIKEGRVLRYDRDDVDAWLKDRTHRPAAA